MERLEKNIPWIQKAATIEEIVKGFSGDKKYVVDGKYLVRVFDGRETQRRKEEFKTLEQLARLSQYVPQALESGDTYMVLSYLPGEDGETALDRLPHQDQYMAGWTAGAELKKLHALNAPKNLPSWFERKQMKNDKYLAGLKELPIDPGLVHLLERYIKKHEWLMEGRPSHFQHDDFHPSNLLIANGKFSGIIDFQRMDWGDPLHDLVKLGFFSYRISLSFTMGVLHGYHEGDPPEEFWRLYTLYAAMHAVSALVWSWRRNEREFNQLYTYSMDVLRDHKNFTEIVPSWYRKEQKTDENN